MTPVVRPSHHHLRLERAPPSAFARTDRTPIDIHTHNPTTATMANAVRLSRSGAGSRRLAPASELRGRLRNVTAASSVRPAGLQGSTTAAHASPQSLDALSRLRSLLLPGGADAAAAAAASPAAPAPGAASLPLPEWAQRFRRQVSRLPGGKAGAAQMQQLLVAVQDIRAKARSGGAGAPAGGAGTSPIVLAYIQLALVDLTSQAWQQRMQELQSVRQTQVGPAATAAARAVREARLALCGCRFLRIEAVQAFAQAVHRAVDGEGHCPGLDLSALPAAHAVGINLQQLIGAGGLGVDLERPALRTIGGEQLERLQRLGWAEYHGASCDASLCGEFQFGFWSGDASLVPAPFAKFSTAELAALVTPELVLGSLANGVWGRALLSAALQAGAPPLGAWQPGQPAHAMAGAGDVGSASAWLFREGQFGLRNSLSGSLRQAEAFAVAVVAATVTLLQQGQQQQ